MHADSPPDRPHNYSADAGAGSNTIITMGDHPGLRAALLGTVAAGALWLGAARYARADCTAAGAVVNCTDAILGNVPPFIANGGIDIPDTGYTTLNVYDITNDIQPASGVDGIYFTRAGAGDTITIISDTGPYSIITTGGAGVDGIYALADGSVTIDHTGNIYASSFGIYARGLTNAVDVSVTATGTITGGNSGIYARSEGSGTVSVTANGDVVGTSRIGIYAGNQNGTDITIESDAVTGDDYGILALNNGTGALDIVTNGDVEGTGAASTGIFARNVNGTDLSIESAAVTGGNSGIRARNYGTGAIDITAGDAIDAGSDGIYARNNAGTSISIESEAVTGGLNGIAARNIGTGALDIAAGGDVTGTNFYGIYARNDTGGTNLSIEVTNVTGGTNGIVARNSGSGTLKIVATGTVTGTYDMGIFARNNAAGTNLSIESAAVTGGNSGIRAGNYGTGALDITASGAVEGTNVYGIYARNYGTGLSIETEAVTGSNNGIRARNYGTGALDIIANGAVEGTGAASTGIDARNYGISNFGLSIETQAVTGGNYGILARNFGSGALDIVANGAVEGTNNIGIFARNHNGTDLSIDSAAVTGGLYGIRAINYGTGALDIVVNGDVEGTDVNSTGIYARNYGTSNFGLSIETKAVTGSIGIAARNYGSGALDIDAGGSVTGTTGDGIYARNQGTDLTVTTAVGTTVTGGDGIFARNYGTGALDIVANGDVEGTGGVYTFGIYARNQGTDLTIVSEAVTGTIGIAARNYGSGALSITANGDVESSTTGNGIFARNFGTDLTIESAAVTGGGIFARNEGSGVLAIVATGTVEGSIDPGIYARNDGTDLSIQTEAVTGGTYGIRAHNLGDGALSIVTNGAVVGTNAIGIYAANLASGTDVTIETGDVTGGTFGIFARNFGTGDIDIAIRGDVTGTTADGIFAYHLGGPIRIVVDTGASVTSNGGGADDFAIQTQGGPGDVTVSGTLNGGAGGAVAFDQVAALDDRMTLHPTAIINGNVLAGPGSDSLVFGGTGEASFDVSLIGAGQQFQDFELFAKEDASHWTLTGTNTGIDNFTVNGGLLTVNGVLPNAAFDVTDGTLGGTGTIGPVTVANGALLAPGNSIGTLTVNGVFTLQTGAIYEVEADAAGRADKVVVAGTVNLSGAVLRVLAIDGNYKPKTEYVIVDNDGNDAVQGKFARVTSSLAFLTPTVDYKGGTGNDVVLFLERNIGPDGPKSFCDEAVTKNQCSVAHALDRFPTDDPLFLAVLNQTAAGARQAFDALSGEIHATLTGVLADDSRYVREAVLGRLVQASHTNDMGQVAALGAGGPQVASLNTYDQQAMALGYGGKHLAAPAPGYGAAFWTRAYGAWGDFDGDGNAASADRDLGGFISGVDTQISGTWRAGLAAGGAWSNVSVGDRRSNADIESFNLAGYVGGMAGPLALRGGGSWTWSEIDTSRAVLFPGFFERQESSYDADTGQIFGEIAYPTMAGRFALEPFVGLAYVNIDTDVFRERGGALSALTGSSDDEDVGYSTLGLRAATIAQVSSLTVVPKISAAWQHAFDDVTPGASLAFASTGIGFGIAGVPLAQDSFLLEAGLDFALSVNATLGVSYTGQFADDVSDNGIKGRLTWLF